MVLPWWGLGEGASWRMESTTTTVVLVMPLLPPLPPPLPPDDDDMTPVAVAGGQAGLAVQVEGVARDGALVEVRQADGRHGRADAGRGGADLGLAAKVAVVLAVGRVRLQLVALAVLEVRRRLVAHGVSSTRLNRGFSVDRHTATMPVLSSVLEAC
jgi:hypothetical protein